MTGDKVSAPEGRIVVFSREPEAGKCKTRLIPVLGHAGASFLYKKLINHMLEISCCLMIQSNINWHSNIILFSR